MDTSTITSLLRPYIDADPRLAGETASYLDLLLKWNAKINLTGVRDPGEMVTRHFGESFFAAKTLLAEGERFSVIDLGSGAGFPGMPIAMLAPETNVTLIESNIKKATFLAEVVRELGLKDIQVLVRRYEELNEEMAPLDYVCSRALGEYPDFLKWAGSEQAGAKQVILWIGARDLPEIQKIATWDWRDPISVPHSLQRLLLVGSKKSATAVPPPST